MPDLIEHPLDLSTDDWQRIAAGRVDRSQLIALFYDSVQPDAKATAEAGRPKFKNVTFIRILIPHDRQTKIDRPCSEQDKSDFPEAWKNYELRHRSTPDGETPLAMWPQLTPAQVFELRAIGVHSVDALAGMPDEFLVKHAVDPMWRELAREYLAPPDETTKKLRAQVGTLRRDLELAQENHAAAEARAAGLTAKVQDLEAQVTALKTKEA